MMATVPHVISGLGLRKFQADGFLLTRVYNACENREAETNSSLQNPLPSFHYTVCTLHNLF